MRRMGHTTQRRVILAMNTQRCRSSQRQRRLLNRRSGFHMAPDVGSSATSPSPTQTWRECSECHFRCRSRLEMRQSIMALWFYSLLVNLQASWHPLSSFD